MFKGKYQNNAALSNVSDPSKQAYMMGRGAGELSKMGTAALQASIRGSLDGGGYRSAPSDWSGRGVPGGFNMFAGGGGGGGGTFTAGVEGLMPGQGGVGGGPGGLGSLRPGHFFEAQFAPETSPLTSPMRAGERLQRGGNFAQMLAQRLGNVTPIPGVPGAQKIKPNANPYF